jgi:hypothetical protein
MTHGYLCRSDRYHKIADLCEATLPVLFCTIDGLM